MVRLTKVMLGCVVFCSVAAPLDVLTDSRTRKVENLLELTMRRALMAGK